MRPLAILAVLLWCCAGIAAAADQTPASAISANPKPTFDQPRKIVLSLSESDPARINEVISNIGNIQKYYGTDYVRIALVAYGPGIHAVLTKDSTVKPRIAGLVAIGVEVLACGATLDSLHKNAGDVLPGVRVVPNGIPELVERQIAGRIYVRP